jgi:hypothetical protein
MNPSVRASARLVAFVALASAGCVSAPAPDTVDAGVGRLVRALGYGAGLHNFKNYVLRGNDEYRAKAGEFLTRARKTIASLRADPGIKDKEKAALEGIESVVRQYQANLPAAQKMIADGKSVKEIDAAVKVDDAPAIAGLAVLRSGRTWTALDNLEAALGYGGAIHNFKNYVLRGKDEYASNAVARFKDAADALVALRADSSLGGKERQALDDIEGVLKKYAANVDKVRKMTADGKSIPDIDAAVKVDDAPATAGLAVLRKE